MAIAVVTGASKGLGRALAEELAERGWTLVVDARHGEDLAEAERAILPRPDPGASLVAVAGDVADAEHRRRPWWRRRSAWAGSTSSSTTPAARHHPAARPRRLPRRRAARRVLEVNVVAPLALVQEAMALLRRSARPAVLNITSDASVEAYEGWGGYGLSKAALDHMSAVLAVEEPTLLVWAVDPGDMRTQMHQDAFPGEDISDRPLARGGRRRPGGPRRGGAAERTVPPGGPAIGSGARARDGAVMTTLSPTDALAPDDRFTDGGDRALRGLPDLRAPTPARGGLAARGAGHDAGRGADARRPPVRRQPRALPLLGAAPLSRRRRPGRRQHVGNAGRRGARYSTGPVARSRCTSRHALPAELWTVELRHGDEPWFGAEPGEVVALDGGGNGRALDALRRARPGRAAVGHRR